MLNQAAGKRDLMQAAITLFAGLCILGLFIIAFGGHRFWESLDQYIIRFNGVKNLDVGRPVKYAGIDGGRVLEIGVDENDPRLIRVVIGLKHGFTVYDGTAASVSQKGLVGDNYVLLNLMRQAGAPLKVGSDIPPDVTPDFMDVAASMATMAADLKPKIAEIADSLRELLNTDNRRQVESLLKEMNVLVSNADKTLRSMDRDFKNVTGEAGQGIRETRALVREMREGMNATLGSLNGAITGVHGDTAQTLAVLRMQAEAVGTAITVLSGQLQRDLDYDQGQFEEVLENTAELTHNLKVLTQSLKERPWQILYHPDDQKKE